MTTKDSGNFAFPVNSELNGTNYSHGGMMLRDYFAAGLGAALFSNPNFVSFINGSRRDGELYGAATARLAYEYADAMILERAK